MKKKELIAQIEAEYKRLVNTSHSFMGNVKSDMLQVQHNLKPLKIQRNYFLFNFTFLSKSFSAKLGKTYEVWTLNLFEGEVRANVCPYKEAAYWPLSWLKKKELQIIADYYLLLK